MIRLRQHIPNYVDGVDGYTAQAASVEALVAIPCVASYAEDVEPIERRGTVTGWVKGVRRDVAVIYTAPAARRFYRWSRSDDDLMVEHNNGDHFWVVGRLSADDPSELATLQEWVEPETAKVRREAWNRGDTGPVKAGYRCAEHGIDDALCCLPRRRRA